MLMLGTKKQLRCVLRTKLCLIHVKRYLMVWYLREEYFSKKLFKKMIIVMYEFVIIIIRVFILHSSLLHCQCLSCTLWFHSLLTIIYKRKCWTDALFSKFYILYVSCYLGDCSNINNLPVSCLMSHQLCSWLRS